MRQRAAAVWLYFEGRSWSCIRITRTNMRAGSCLRVEAGEEYKETALREVKEETGVSASIIKYIGKSQYTFNTPQDVVEKDVHWYLMMADSYYSKPQREEYFLDSGYYKFYEAYHLLKFSNEKQILEKAYNEYLDLKRSNLWGSKKYF